MSALSCSRDATGNAPVAKTEIHTDTVNGVVRTDPYYWLNDRYNPDVITYLEAENAYTEQVMKATEEMQKSLFAEMRNRIKEDDTTAPARDGEYYYYIREEPGENYEIYCRKKGSLEAPEEVLLDVNKIATGLEYCELGVFEVSPNGKLLAYSVDDDGSERHKLYIKDLTAGRLLADSIENTATSLAWAADNKTLFYVTLDEQTRPWELYRHRIGDAQEQDVRAFQEPDLAFFLDIVKSKDKKYLLIKLSSNVTTEEWYLDAATPEEPFTLVEPRRNEIEYYVEHHGDLFYILTNDGAQNFKLMTAPEKDPSRSNWKEFVEHREDVYLYDVEVFADFIALFERANGLKRIGIIVDPSPRNKQVVYVEFPEAAYTIFQNENPEFDTDLLRFSYSSLITPKTEYDYNIRDKSLTVVKETQVLGGYDRSQYTTERIHATASDGTIVPMSVVYRKDTKLDGSAPLYMYGYGAYGISTDPSFRTHRLSILDRGFVFVQAHVRGGGEMGRGWYEGGKLENKRNTFTDFIACGEHLIEKNYTSRDKLVIYGGSAGGLLIGAVVNMRPDLFKIAVADVPFVDVVTTMLDTTIPLTVTEFEEWGNPAVPEYYNYMMSYSPYDNIEAKEYPHLLVMAGLNDPRVGYWEPAKYTAKLRSLKTDHNRLLLKTNMGSGHFGQSGRYGYLDDLAFEYAFIFDILGIAL